jgi:chromosome segregation ATPase
LSIKILQDQLGEEAEFDAEETAHMRSVRRDCEKRVNQYEDRMVQLQSDMQREIDQQVALLKKATKERNDAHDEANDAQRGAITMFNEQKHHETHKDRMKDDVHRANIAVDKMRDEAVRLRSKINDLREERSTIKKQQESRIAEEEAIAEE